MDTINNRAVALLERIIATPTFSEKETQTVDPLITFAIVIKPTKIWMAIAEKGSLVLDFISIGRAGLAAREEGDNAIYKALKDIQWLSSYQFPIEDGQPVPVKMTVTHFKAELQHNIIPAQCTFTVDIKFDHSYTQKEILNTITNHTFCEATVHAT